MFRPALLVLALTVAAAAAPARADEQARLDLAIELLAQMDMGQVMASMEGQIQAMIAGQLEQMATCEAMRPALDAYARDSGALISESFGGDAFIAEAAKLYVEVFDRDELQGLLEFYRSPLGRKMLDKMPELMQGSMAVAQQHVESLMPRIEALATTLGAQLETAGEACRKKSN